METENKFYVIFSASHTRTIVEAKKEEQIVQDFEKAKKMKLNYEIIEGSLIIKP